jgi:hypothetical protein
MMIGIRRRSMKLSSGASQVKPSGAGSPGGLISRMKAGRTVMLVA